MKITNDLQPLSGIRIVLLALNVPGPVAASRLARLGATVVKIEPPAGDPLSTLSASWYAELRASFEVRTLNLKLEQQQRELHALLDTSDALITSFRPSSLARLGLARAQISERHPTLCHVSIVGHAAPHDEIAGHDLTYQARSGLIVPPIMPVALLADLSGAERTVSMVTTLLLSRARGGTNLFAEVSLEDTAAELRASWQHRTTHIGGPLGGANPLYNLYETKEGWIALAALEPHFVARLHKELALEAATAEELSRVFAENTAAYWEAWAQLHDIPIVAVQLARH